MPTETHFERIVTLVQGAAHPPPGRARIALALAFGAPVHLVFAAAVLAMIVAMYFSMIRARGRGPAAAQC